MPIWRILVFIISAAAVLFLSRSTLRRPDSHGYYRTFAFVLILALILWVLDGWFARPFSPRQILSWLLLVASLLLVGSGFARLLRHGRPQGSFENTTALVSTGIYRYIRHPMYASLLYLTWGAFLKAPGWIPAALALAATWLLWRTAAAEERENLAHFGAGYEQYMRSTRRFIPFVF